jgi:SagB-type dehydrogenase family enzyme
MRTPVRPRLINELAFVSVGNGLLVEGTEAQQLFRGPAVDSLLPRLFAVLDGQHEFTDLVRVVPEFPPQMIAEALALLFSRGLLEDGAADVPIDVRLPSPLVSFARRHVDTTRRNRAASQGLARLAAARVAVVGPMEDAHLLIDELAGCGILAAWHEPSEIDQGHTLVVGLTNSRENIEALATLDDRCAEWGVRWLRAVRRGCEIEIGPCFHRAQLACYRCFAGAGNTHTPPGGTVAHVLVWISLVAMEIVNLISWLCPPVSGLSVLRWNLDNGTQRRLRWFRVPGCPHCLPLPQRARRDMPLAFAYEEAVAPPPYEYLNTKEHQRHYLLANLELQKEQKEYTHRPSVPLTRAAPPSGGVLDGWMASPPYMGVAAPSSLVRHSRLELPVLAGILERVGGIRTKRVQTSASRRDKVQRWIPTGGNLGSVEIFVQSRRVEGLEPGWYFYQAATHDLAWLQGNLAVGPHPEAPVLLVLAAAHARVRRKYGALAYRIVHLDAGVALAQLLAVASGYGLRAYPILAWDDRPLIKALALDPELEPIVAMASLYEGVAPDTGEQAL